MTAIDKQSRLPDRFWVAVSPGIRALEDHSEDRLIELAVRVFQASPSIGFGEEVRTNYQIYHVSHVSEYVVVWKFDRIQCKPDAASHDAHSVALTLRLDSEC